MVVLPLLDRLREKLQNLGALLVTFRYMAHPVVAFTEAASSQATMRDPREPQRYVTSMCHGTSENTPLLTPHTATCRPQASPRPARHPPEAIRDGPCHESWANLCQDTSGCHVVHYAGYHKEVLL
jgi:hypothetical protein